MSYVARVILACVAMVIMVGMTHQAWTYLRGLTVISRRQFALRMTTGCLLLLTMGLIFYLSVRPPTTLASAAIFWGLLTLLPLVVCVLAWLDLRELARASHLRQAELYRGLAELQKKTLADRTPPDPQGGDRRT